ncbi:MAG TPA: MEDS domain-containing protein [Cytophagaceae bacterium]|jgi:signal transduction histidine kinase|nr:MEDS domain-containing protein [Cytophagaceae bacterium]
MRNENTYSGIDIIGYIPWGTHFCSFYDTRKDLLEILIPFFKAGLENNEFCMWITSPPLTINEATNALKEMVPDIDDYIAKQSIEIISHVNWYTKGGLFDPENVNRGWRQKLDYALERRYIGMRVNGNEGWLEGNVWKNFIDYEMRLDNSIHDSPIIVLCSYPLKKCTASTVLDVARVHEMVISKRNERWEILEVPQLKKTKAQLNKMNGILEQQVAQRTKELEIIVAQLKEEITSRKKAEEELAKIANDLMQRNTNLQQFTFIVSHYLRAPIASILGISNVLKCDLSDEEKSEIQQFLFNAVKQLDEIVKDLNNILQTKFEITEKKELVYFSTLVSAIKLSIENVIRKENVQIIMDFSAIDQITTIKSYMHSIFYNLISNSIKFRHPDKTPVLRIKSETDKEKMRISFKDNGIGIDLNKQGEKIFGPYQRFHMNIEGKGLGLFIAKIQVEVLGGNINVKSDPNIGTEFIIELPL